MAHLPKYLRFAIFKSNVLSISCCLMRHSLLFLTVYDLTAVATVVYLTSYYSRTLSFPPHLIIYGTQTVMPRYWPLSSGLFHCCSVSEQDLVCCVLFQVKWSDSSSTSVTKTHLELENFLLKVFNSGLKHTSSFSNFSKGQLYFVIWKEEPSDLVDKTFFHHSATLGLLFVIFLKKIDICYKLMLIIKPLEEIVFQSTGGPWFRTSSTYDVLWLRPHVPYIY